MTSTTTPIRYVGALLILAVGAIHAYEAPTYLSLETYVGVLFIAAAVGSLVVALALLRIDDLRVWGLGALISISCFAGFVLARTTGLPAGFKETQWSTIGVISLIVESAFVLVAIAARGVIAPRIGRRPATGSYA